MCHQITGLLCEFTVVQHMFYFVKKFRREVNEITVALMLTAAYIPIKLQKGMNPVWGIV